MSEKIDYERYLPELKNAEFYVVKGNGGGATVLMLTGEVICNVTICRFGETVARLVNTKGCAYIGVGYFHGLWKSTGNV